MAERAHVTSVEAIAAFRSRLIIYLNQARTALEEVSNEVLRTRQWLQNDQRRYWEDQIRHRQKKFERAQSELSSARMSKLQEASVPQQMEVRKTREALQNAQTKLGVLKRWDRDLEDRTEPLLRQANQLQHSLTTDLPRAIVYLTQVIKTLDAYTGVAVPGSMLESPTPAGESTVAPAPDTEKTSDTAGDHS
ncbi:MAG: hypothetical protein ACTHLW_16825 [Verrucomicrobiota bacterium]